MGIYTVNCSETHECGNWDWGQAIPVLGIFISNFRYCVLVVRHLEVYVYEKERLELAAPLTYLIRITSFHKYMQ